jgi:hypothetical protein
MEEIRDILQARPINNQKSSSAVTVKVTEDQIENINVDCETNALDVVVTMPKPLQRREFSDYTSKGYTKSDTYSSQ